MIKLINGHDQSSFKEVVEQIFRMRAEVFSERLGWSVKVQNGMEIDVFDDYDPLYLASIDPQTGRVQGSLRLLPTTGPNMLRDVFPALLPNGERVESPLIWESSRFCTDPGLARAPGKLHSVTIELFCGVIEVGLRAGLDCVVSVYGAGMSRIFRRAHWPAQTIGQPYQYGDVLTHAGIFEISQDARQRLGVAGGHHEPVIKSFTPSMEFLPRPVTTQGYANG